ncbi:response regulator [Caulobacter sp. 17J80-11]|uniref:response regulator n=1 Tax=Caulobacter sp. 17J80-11 TaxID=2763502 RepID=UPI001653DBDF|nr:response regulator [Caulobacter sp. 17J80-11]MBC6983048.1 response regulator [Caulobacter sp. 17J80-11]
MAGKRLRILVVEDQSILALEIELVLRDLGHEVIGTATDLDHSLALASSEQIDLALVDVNLTDGPTGPEIARRLVADHGAVVIFLTANPEQIPSCFSGAIGVMPKPFDDGLLRDVLAFAANFVRNRELGPAPRQFRVAPWLLASPDQLDAC